MKAILCPGAILLFSALLAAQTPAVVENGVLNAASYAGPGTPGNAVAPGSLVAIFGSDLAGGLSQADSVPLSTSLANVSVTFGNTPAALLFVSPGQVNAQLPWNLLPEGAQSGTATVVVTRNGLSSQARTVLLAPISPGFFTLPGTGLGPAVVVNSSDGSISQPAGSVTGIAAHPASRGSAIIIYANGLGPVTPAVQNGQASLDALRRTVTTPTVLIGGVEAQVLFSGLTPQFPGVNQVNVVVPADAPIGDSVPLQFRFPGITTSEQVTIAVSQ
jgi:uncharacterized protein (TIGR03437 family)